MYCRLGSSVCCLIDPSILHISRTVRYDMMIDSIHVVGGSQVYGTRLNGCHNVPI